jgi:N-acyl homoserine lactone hydrolase
MSFRIVVNTHLHFDHCGGNHLFAGRPIYVQRLELDDARSKDDYTIREWVNGEIELLPGLRLVLELVWLTHEHEPWRPRHEA